MYKIFKGTIIRFNTRRPANVLFRAGKFYKPKYCIYTKYRVLLVKLTPQTKDKHLKCNIRSSPTKNRKNVFQMQYANII